MRRPPASMTCGSRAAESPNLRVGADGNEPPVTNRERCRFRTALVERRHAAIDDDEVSGNVFHGMAPARDR